jgi:hypothetical protein
LRGGVDRAFLDEAPSIDEGGRETGNEDENFRRVEETKCLERKVAEDVFRDVVNEDEDQCYASKEIEAEIA